MRHIEDIVFESYKELIDEIGIDIIPSKNTEMNSDNGIDSMGIVTFVLNLEEKFDLEFDNYLHEFRKCKNLGEVIELMESIVVQK